MIVLKRYPDSMSANIAKSILEDSGIDSFVADEALANADPPVVFASGGLRLMVADEDYERAAKVLARREQGPELSEDFDPGTAEEEIRAPVGDVDSRPTAPGSAILGGGGGLVGLVVIAASIVAGALLMFTYLKLNRSPLVSEGDLSYDTDRDGNNDLFFRFLPDGGSETHSDYDGDGKIDAIYIYDRNNALVSGKTDRDFDGRFESSLSTENGLEVDRIDRDGDEVVDQIESYQHNVLHSTQWLRGGKVWKRSLYDRFQKVREEVDRDGDGIFEVEISFLEGEEPQ